MVIVIDTVLSVQCCQLRVSAVVAVLMDVPMRFCVKHAPSYSMLDDSDDLGGQSELIITVFRDPRYMTPVEPCCIRPSVAAQFFALTGHAVLGQMMRVASLESGHA